MSIRDMSKYEAIRPKLDTGDIVLFSGSGFISRLIQMISKSKWSHVGMVIKSAEWDMLLLWESTTLSKIKDIESRKQTQGVQLVPLSERIKCYKEGCVAFRRLIGGTEEQRLDMQSKLKDFRSEVKGRNYEESKWELFRAAYDGAWGLNEADLSSLFCSEMINEAYRRMGLIYPDPVSPSNEFIPGEFSTLNKLYMDDFSLGDHIYV